MPNFNSPKKRAARESVDGILSDPRRQIGTPTYYRGSSEVPKVPSPVRASRKRPQITESVIQKPAEPVTEIGDFSKEETGKNFGSTMLGDAPKKEKKQKREPGRLRRWWKNRSLKFKAALVSAVLILGLGGLLGVRLYSFLHSVFAKGVGNSASAALNDKVSADKVNTEGDGRLNVLILGRGGDENAAPNLTDTIIVASIDLETQEASLLSLPRDMWVQTSGGSSNKINSVYNSAVEKAQYNGMNAGDAEKEGVKAAINSTRLVAGVPIHKYMLLDFKAFRDVVNALGGVDLNVPTAINDYYTNYFFKAGQQHMDGNRALQYARSRHGSARGDFDRSERQRQLLVAMRQKASSTGIVANPVRLNSLANAIQKNIRTDLSLDEAKTLFMKSKDLPDNKISSLDLAKPNEPLVTTGTVNGLSIVRPVAGVNDYSKIRAYTRSNMLDPFLKKEAPTVSVYNGSGKAGAATIVADVLKGFGYKILEVESSQTIQSKTVVTKQTQTDKPFTYRYLSQRFNTIPVTGIPSGAEPAAKPATAGQTTTTPAKADFVVILGTDYVQKTDATW